MINKSKLWMLVITLSNLLIQPIMSKENKEKALTPYQKEGLKEIMESFIAREEDKFLLDLRNFAGDEGFEIELQVSSPYHIKTVTLETMTQIYDAKQIFKDLDSRAIFKVKITPPREDGEALIKEIKNVEDVKIWLLCKMTEESMFKAEKIKNETK